MKATSIAIVSFGLILAGAGYAQKMTVKDSDTNILMEVNDEGTVGSLVVDSSNVRAMEIDVLTLPPIPASSTTTNKLYNVSGTLYWNGSAIGIAGSAGGWTDGGSVVYTSNTTDSVAIGMSAPSALLHVNGTWVLGSDQSLINGIEGYLYSPSGLYYKAEGSDWAHFFSASGGGDIAHFSTGSVGEQAEIRMVIDNSGRVGIGTVDPDASSVLEMFSTSQGLLPPRMNAAQRDAIVSPATGLLIFNTETLLFNYYHGDEWYEIAGSPVSDGPGDCTNTGGTTKGTATYLGEISGDTGGDSFTRYGCGEGWFQVFLTEDDTNIIYDDLTIKVTLQPPVDMDYDLHIETSTLSDDSNNSGSTEEICHLSITDTSEDNSCFVWIQITKVSGSENTNWELDILGNQY